jgi:hypothetical protein
VFVTPDPTARRWAYLTWIAVTALCVVVGVRCVRQVEEYDARFARATDGLAGSVVETGGSSKARTVTVEWTGRDGLPVRGTFDVDHDAGFRVGDTFYLVRAPGEDEVFPADRGRVRTTDMVVLAVLGIALALLVLQLPWLLRFRAWRRAARGPTRAYRASLLVSFGKGGLVAVPWLRLTGEAGVRYQRIMWEPSLSGWRNPAEFAVTARRAGRNGPFVVDVPGRGRFWSAGPARAREPFLEHLMEGSYSGTPHSRWPTVLVAFAATACLAALLVAVQGSDPVNGMLAGLVVGGLGVSVALFYGGAPFYRKPR